MKTLLNVLYHNERINRKNQCKESVELQGEKGKKVIGTRIRKYSL